MSFYFLYLRNIKKRECRKPNRVGRIKKLYIMAQMINRGKELIRICPTQSTKIEYSTNGGRVWITRYSGTSAGDFHDLTDNGKEILAQTSKGLYYSNNEGRVWVKRS